MFRPEEVERLMLKLKRHAGAVPQQLAANPDARRQKAANLPDIDLTPYRRADAWPGREYALVGNSFHVESRIADPNHDQRRAACIAMLLAQGGLRRLVFVTDALTNDGFNHVLSCFERNWLNRVSADTVIGPAYGPDGEMIAQSFAVWRCVATITTVHREEEESGRLMVAAR